MGDAGESELTAKAREVLAGLSKAQRESVALMATPGAVWLGYMRTRNALVRLGVCDANGRLRDVGREVARLLSEVQS